MEQREVTDKEGITWTCVQAYAALEGKDGEKAAKLSESKDHTVPVVCTPGGGAQSVRVQLNKNWFNTLEDEDLLAKIAAEREQV